MKTKVFHTVGDNYDIVEDGIVIGNIQGSKKGKLIAEAFNVANETGKSPRQLADENKELVEALKLITSQIKIHDTGDWYQGEIYKAEQAINRSTKQ